MYNTKYLYYQPSSKITVYKENTLRANVPPTKRTTCIFIIYTHSNTSDIIPDAITESRGSALLAAQELFFHIIPTA